MAIADEYVIRCLLQDTECGGTRLEWRRAGSGAYVARANGVRLKLDSSGTRADSRVVLILHRDGQRVVIGEPQNTGIFRRNYDSDDQRRLSDLMRRLQAAVALQSATRMGRTREQGTLVRQSIYRQLLFSEMPGNAHTSPSIYSQHGVTV